ncbi:FecR domain-containing protein [Sideroxydans lithotrophicus]|uniref:FecR protein domain-containing protein n=1 Tax=Sideroxydans lithotrophicus (strain ES-1) TaxID=580332 RepID=D5CRX2_SIDLE|nr:FecR domain-containing protein [Sideroxydans lithotrophicus]ADE11708.1 conserved hypothetical protein [Sideroxydans lithotrophicus ES-1]
MSRFDEADDPRRRVLIKALAAGAFSAALTDRAALAASIFGTPPSKLPAGQSIYRINGTAKVNGQEANLSTIIKPNDTVETGPKSEIVFVVGGTSMLMRENSHLTLEGKEEGLASYLIQGFRMLTGKLLTVSRSNGTQIRTSTATIGIRGTGYYIESDPEQTYFCTCYGLTDVEANDDPTSRDTVASKHHDKPLYILAGQQPGQNIRRASFINHTDQELMLIETLVGRTPPWVFAGDQYTAPRRDY